MYNRLTTKNVYITQTGDYLTNTLCKFWPICHLARLKEHQHSGGTQSDKCGIFANRMSPSITFHSAAGDSGLFPAWPQSWQEDLSLSRCRVALQTMLCWCFPRARGFCCCRIASHRVSLQCHLFLKPSYLIIQKCTLFCTLDFLSRLNMSFHKDVLKPYVPCGSLLIHANKKPHVYFYLRVWLELHRNVWSTWACANHVDDEPLIVYLLSVSCNVCLCPHLQCSSLQDCPHLKTRIKATHPLLYVVAPPSHPPPCSPLPYACLPSSQLPWISPPFIVPLYPYYPWNNNKCSQQWGPPPFFSP